MIRNGNSLLVAAPIKDMVPAKIREHGVSYGLGEAGYDIRIKQDVRFCADTRSSIFIVDGGPARNGRFVIASAIEEFDMPDNLVGIVHDKSTWARQGLSVFNTVIEPGWKGFLTLELVYHGHEELLIPAGAGIAQVVFHETTDRTAYTGKYQNQEDAPVSAKDS
jgi:dCTP deaminase